LWGLQLLLEELLSFAILFEQQVSLIGLFKLLAFEVLKP
jgi:hypothetical protein